MRALSGDRPCPNEIPIVRFLVGVMKSLASKIIRKHNGEDEQERQLMMMNVFRKSDEGIFRAWAYEMLDPPKSDEPNSRRRDQVWPLVSILEIALDGRPADWRPSYRYD